MRRYPGTVKARNTPAVAGSVYRIRVRLWASLLYSLQILCTYYLALDI